MALVYRCFQPTETLHAKSFGAPEIIQYDRAFAAVYFNPLLRIGLAAIGEIIDHGITAIPELQQYRCIVGIFSRGWPKGIHADSNHLRPREVCTEVDIVTGFADDPAPASCQVMYLGSGGNEACIHRGNNIHRAVADGFLDGADMR